jgi:hypothetical protein
MKCPHCLVDIHFDGRKTFLVGTNDGEIWSTVSGTCSACDRPIVLLHVGSNDKPFDEDVTAAVLRESLLAYPKGTARIPVPTEVPTDLAGDYAEACIVLADSPKASAALSRRCLQHLLRKAAHTTKRDLADQIDEVMPSLPSLIQNMIDGVRVIGNMAAHPMKSTNTGEILDVEPGEAEWLLDTLEELFDHYYVKPARIQQRRTAINKKLKEAGKPALK